MAITFPGTVSTGVQSTGARTIVISSHDPSSCDLLLAVAGFNANCTLSASGGGVDSNVDGSFTSVFTSTRSGSSGDAAVQIYGLLNPTDSAANITFDWGTGVLPNAAWAAVINVSGVNTASLALATNNTEQQVDNTGGTGLTFSPGGGTAGNISLVAVSVIGDDADGTFTNDEAETVLVEIDTGGGAGNNDDHSAYIAYSASPSSPAITWTPIDESAGLLLELAGGGIAAQAAYHYRNHGKF